MYHGEQEPFIGRKKWICTSLLPANMSQDCKKLRSKSGAKIVNATFTIASYLHSFFWYANVAFAIFAP